MLHVADLPSNNSKFLRVSASVLDNGDKVLIGSDVVARVGDGKVCTFAVT